MEKYDSQVVWTHGIYLATSSQVYYVEFGDYDIEPD
jgi:hypothetical protein